MTQQPVYDLCVVGGGPTGVVAAAHAASLGLRTLLLERDRLLRGVLSRSSEELKPLVEQGLWPQQQQLSFHDGSQHCLKTLPEMGVTVLERHALLAWSDNDPFEMEIQSIRDGNTTHHTARHLLVATGRGFERADLNIPGSLTQAPDQESLTDAPLLVIGETADAVATVCALANTKDQRGHRSPVYWSFLGDTVPVVGLQECDRLGRLISAGAPLRLCPNTRPLLDPVGDRVLLLDAMGHADLPVAAVQSLAFPSDRVLLKTTGARLSDGLIPRSKQGLVRMDPDGQHTPGVWPVGAVLSPAYEERQRDADTHRTVAFPKDLSAYIAQAKEVVDTIAASLAPPEETPTAVTVTDDRRPIYLLEVDRLGNEAKRHEVRDHGTTTVGSGDCNIRISDPALSDHHATIHKLGDAWRLQDAGGRQGVFIRTPKDTATHLPTGTLLRVGEQYLLLSQEGDAGFVTHFDRDGAEQNRFQLGVGYRVIGKEATFTLAVKDREVARRHVAVKRAKEDGFLVKDLHTFSGTWARVVDHVDLHHDDQIMMGPVRFRFFQEGQTSEAELEINAPPAELTRNLKAEVTFGIDGPCCPIKPGQTLLAAAEENNIWLRSECKAGVCGSDPVRIIEGAHNLFPPVDARERETLEQICGLEANNYRLACRAQVYGPVVIEVVAM